MMTREERAKQFMPFDAMKGLQKALREKEKNRTKIKKPVLSDEVKERISETLQELKTDEKIIIKYYAEEEETEKTAVIEKIDTAAKYLVINSEEIDFDDIYSIEKE